MQMTGAEVMVKCLAEQGVTTVFGYPGGAILPFYDALREAADIRHILTAHEQGAAHAADGYARAGGQVGVCIATSGPGATNLVTGLANAFLDSIPVVAITGQVPVAMIGRDAFQEVDITGITMPITKHNFVVRDVEELADTVRDAFRIAASGRPGPVLIDIPKDITAAKCEFIPKGKVEINETYEISDEELQEEKQIAAAVAAINASQRPVMLVGGGVINADAEYGEGKNQNFLRPEDTEKIVWVFDNMVEVPGYSKIVKIADILDEKTNDANLNISRYVDNAPPQEPHDVRAHMLGGVPNVEIEALNGLIAKYDIAPADIFSDRGDGYSDFLERCATKGMIKSYISDHAGVLSAKERMHGAFEDFWIEAALAVNSVHTDMGIAEFAIKFTNLLAETLEPLGILDRFQCQGVFANWWEHSYTVREYTEIEQSVDGKETKVDVKEVIRIKNVFKTISSEGFVASLVSDDKIASEHFADELEELHRLRDDAENAQADLMAYVASIEMETDDEDSDDGDEEKEPKEPSVKEVETYLKSLGTDEAKASLKQIAALKKEKNRLNREVKKKESELQEKIDAIREELTEEQCEDLVMQLLHDGFVEELDAYLSAEVQKTIHAVSKLWEKYHVSVAVLLDKRKVAEDKLNGFLAQLGYIPKKEVDA